MAPTALGGLALVVMALEGVICIIMAAPLGLGATVVGGLFGRALALSSRHPPKQMLSSFALLPSGGGGGENERRPLRHAMDDAPEIKFFRLWKEPGARDLFFALACFPQSCQKHQSKSANEAALILNR